MNSPEQITVSLEWAKKLETAEWPQSFESFVWWEHEKKTTGEIRWTIYPCGEQLTGRSWNLGECFSAPTAEEILRRLPTFIGRYQVTVRSMADLGWSVQYGNVRPFAHWFSEKTLANAAAAMYCHLAENGLLPTP